MPGSFQFDTPTPLAFFASLVADDASLLLVEAAASIAQDDLPTLDIQSVMAEFDALAGKLKRRVAADAVPVQRLRLLNRYFFQELGFGGNVNDYYDPSNSYLHRVLETRRGIPITLAVLYIEFAEQVGLPARGVSFPGHFLVKMRMSSGRQNGEVVIDPFNGHSLSREELDELLAPYKHARGLHDEFDIPLGLFLQAAAPREIVARLLRNLKEIFRNAGDERRLLAAIDRLVILLPDAAEERRDRALVLAKMGDLRAACDDLAAYLRARSDAEDHAALSAQLREWLVIPRPPLH